MSREALTTAPDATLAAMQGVRLNRRSALKLGAAAAFVATGLAEPFSAHVSAESCESPYPRSPEFLIVDFGPVACHPRVHQDVVVSNPKMFTNMAIHSNVEPKDRLPFQLLAAGLSSVTDGGAIREIVLEKVPQLRPLADFLDEKQNHGLIVARVIWDVLDAQGIRINPTLYPIQDFYESVSVEDDGQGNRTFYIETDRDRFEDALSRYPESKIANFSWQNGKLGIRISKNGGIEILGAYRKETALENLTDLAMICNAYPEKLFVVAAGNHDDDLRETIEVLPENVIVVGEWFPGEWEENNQGLWLPRLNARGAHLYVPTKNQKYNRDNYGGSTLSTARISAESIRELHLSREAPAEVKDAVFAKCDTVRHDEPVGRNAFGETIYEKTTTRVFNPLV